MAAGFDEEKKSFCFVVVEFELIFRHPCFDVICACTEFFGEVVYFTERGGFLEMRVICEKLMVDRMACNDVRERCGEQDKQNWPQHRALRLEDVRWQRENEDRMRVASVVRDRAIR